MKIKVVVERTPDWLQARRLETGENVPQRAEIEVEVADLSLRVRQFVLDRYNGCYPNTLDGVAYNHDYTLPRYGSGHAGRMPLIANKDDPASIEDAIFEAVDQIEFRRIEEEKKKADRETERRERAAEWAAWPLEYRITDDGYLGSCVPMDAPKDYRGQLWKSGSRRFDLSEVEKLEPKAFKEAKELASRVREKHRVKRLEAANKLLSEFLSKVSLDALEEALPLMVTKEGVLDSVKEEIEQAAPAPFYIFNRD